MEAVFERKKRLLPRPTDLSFYNWDTQVSTSNATANFQVSSAKSAKSAMSQQPELKMTVPSTVACTCIHYIQPMTRHGTLGVQVIAENEKGLLFKNKRDRKVINVDPKAVPGDNSTRTELQTEEYIQAVIYDHVTRRRA